MDSIYICPRCGATGPFYVESTACFTIRVDGVIELDEADWESDSMSRCGACDYEAPIRIFGPKPSNQ